LRNGEQTTIGAHGCLKLGGDRLEEEHSRSLVPVYYGWRDDIAFLDTAGRAFLQTGDDPEPLPFTADGATMVATLLALELLWSKPVEITADRAAAMAESLALPLIVENARGRVWIGETAIVQQFDDGGLYRSLA
jgi:hypothetical protein